MTHKNQRRASRYLRKYGITFAQYRKLYIAQKRRCVICEKKAELDAGLQGLVVDHCHTNGHVRGLLCSRCNTGLGFFKDNVTYLANAIEYLNSRTELPSVLNTKKTKKQMKKRAIDNDSPFL